MELHAHPFFARLQGHQRDTLEAFTETKSYPDDALIFEEGSPSDGLYLVLNGEVAFCKRNPDGRLFTVGYSQSGDFFGEIGLFTGEPRSLRAEGRGECRVARIPSEALVDFIRNTPGPIDNILQSIVTHLHETTRHYVDDMLRQEKMSVVGQMVNTIIHDFKNPFCLISLGAQLIQQMHQDERTLKLCRNIDEQVQRMVAMAEELSEYSRGQHNLRLNKVNLHGLLNRFRELNYLYFQNDKVTVAIDVPEIWIEAEENKLLRVLQNLVGNAIDAFEDNVGKIEIRARFVNSQEIEMTIADDGPGIPEAIRVSFFDPFVTFGKSRGTGLGTAIAKSVVEAHGGTIRFETAAGEGTRFFITLPVTPPAQDQNQDS